MVKEGNALGHVLYRRMKQHKNRIAQIIVDTNEQDTYGDLLERCVRVAIKLGQLGVGEDDIVGSCTHNHKNSCVPFLASTFLGAIPVSFDSKYSPVDITALLRLVQPKVMFVHQEQVDMISKCVGEAKVAPIFVIFGAKKNEKHYNFDELLRPSPRENEFEVYDTNDPRKTAIILFSSGTTGVPKGICLNHYSILRQLANTEKSGAADRVLSYSNLSWISGVRSLVRTASSGQTRIVCSKFNPVDAWDIMEKYKVTIAPLQPYLLRKIVENRPRRSVNLKNLKLITISGCTPTAAQIEEWMAAFPDAVLLNGYGITEMTGVVACLLNPDDLHFQKEKPTTMGKVLDHIQWKVVDLETETPVGPNHKGELRVKSDTMMNGYYKRDSSSEYDSEGYYKTGDIVYYDQDSCLFFCDRVHETMRGKCMDISPITIEAVLQEHPAVSDAAVIGIPHPEDSVHPMGLVVLHEHSQKFDPEEISKYVNERVGEQHKLAAGVKVVKEIIRTVSGKTRRKLMRDMVLDGIPF